MADMMGELSGQMLGFARDNDTYSIDMLLKLGCPPTSCNRMGQSALHIGAMWGSVDAVKMLLDARADPNQQNKLRSSTPLHAAAMGRGPLDKRLECAKLMVKAGGDPNIPDDSGELPADLCEDDAMRLALGGKPLLVHQAVQGRSAKALAEALQQQDHEVDELNSKAETPLHMAAACGWQEGVKSLLAARAAVNAPDGGLQRPLHRATLRGDHRIVKILLSAKANPSAQDCNMEHDRRFKSATFDEQHDKHRTALHYAAQHGNLLVLRALLGDSRGPESYVNTCDAQQLTPLHLCLGLRKPDAELEVGSGVRVVGLQKRPEWNGRLGSIVGPACASADGSGHRWPVLIDGVESDGVLLKEDNLTMVADDVLDALLDAKADVNKGNFVCGVERTVLHEAAVSGDADLARRVLQTGRARIDAQDKSGLTALHVAARGRRKEVLRLLVEARADVSLTTAGAGGTGGKTAAELARKNGADASVLALLGATAGSARGEGEVSVEEKCGASMKISSLSEEQLKALYIC
mmetsp:Transcript_56889/g.144262  ORF Transcript_56889/g.144262 Transcript_56889/m.144262 type:complete len:522 (+) Transcript_56889:102-1667(+)